MKYWRITNMLSGLDMGIYRAKTQEGALNAMARAAGYRSYAAARRDVPVKPGELRVAEVPAALVRRDGGPLPRKKK